MKSKLYPVCNKEELTKCLKCQVGRWVEPHTAAIEPRCCKGSSAGGILGYDVYTGKQSANLGLPHGPDKNFLSNEKEGLTTSEGLFHYPSIARRKYSIQSLCYVLYKRQEEKLYCIVEKQM